MCDLCFKKNDSEILAAYIQKEYSGRKYFCFRSEGTVAHYVYLKTKEKALLGIKSRRSENLTKNKNHI